MIADEELLRLNSQGFIPGPDETEEEFVRRVEVVKNEFEKGGQIPRAHWDWVRIHLKEAFDFEPHCLPVSYSNRSLAPWQGAAAWIEGGRIVSVQLREGLRKGSYWGYRRSEILAHEAVHAARSAFDAPQFEEFFSYFVSEKWWRRAFGPIVRRPWEVWVFFLAALSGFVFPWAHLFAAIWLGAGSWRLVGLHRTLRRAAKNLMRDVGDPKRARAILVRLTDQEIELFAKGNAIFSYADRQQTMRWRLIRLAYLDKMGGEVSHG